MPAQLEDDKFIDPKFGRLIQLNFGRSSEVKVIDDGFQLEDGGNKDEEPHASKEPSKRLMLQELVNGDTEGNVQKHSINIFTAQLQVFFTCSYWRKQFIRRRK